MKNLYNKIISKFESEEVLNEFLKEGVTPPKYIDTYTKQDTKEDNSDLFNENSLLIDWEVDHVTSPSVANVIFRLTYAQDTNTTSNHEQDIKLLSYVENVHKFLDGLESEETGKLKLTNEGFNKTDSIIKVYILEYNCTYLGRKTVQKNTNDGSYESLQLSNRLIRKNLDTI